MTVEDQDEVIAFLEDPSSYGQDGGSIERIDTHISVIFLAGGRAYKLKRAVKLDFLDFSTLDLRREACEAEVRINRRTAPALYLGVVPVTRRAHDGLELAGGGPVVDWLVEMTRFDQNTLFDRLAERAALTLALIEALADEIVELHAQAERRPDHGGKDGMVWVVDGIEEVLEASAGDIFEPVAVESLIGGLHETLERQGALLEERRRAGLVRRCHGDLHLGNIFLFDGRPMIFDAIEFSDRIACIDVFYDLAFPIMDLWERGEAGLANALFNRYLAATTDLPGLALLPLFLAARAAVRAKVQALLARTKAEGADVVEKARAAARDYLAAAQGLLHPPAPHLVAVAGLSATGKSTLARRVAPRLGAPPGALVLRSDVIRKRMLGLDPSARLGEEGYRPEVSERVYGEIREQARRALQAGHAVIADAVHAKPEERALLEATARSAGVPFTGLWLAAPPDVLEARIRGRQGDASDATVAVLHEQLRYPLGEIAWRKLDASKAPTEIENEALSELNLLPES